jgi:hypothetical protein
LEIVASWLAQCIRVVSGWVAVWLSVYMSRFRGLHAQPEPFITAISTDFLIDVEIEGVRSIGGRSPGSSNGQAPSDDMKLMI